MNFGASTLLGRDLKDDYFMRDTRVMRHGYYTPRRRIRRAFCETRLTPEILGQNGVLGHVISCWN
jgi:hypothetical protein